jgi:N-acetylglucosamine-6-phosphate deacetylase
MALILSGAKVFDGETVRDQCCVVVDSKTISKVGRSADLKRGDTLIELDGGLLAPGFIDVQVNGGGGALLNRDPSAETVHLIATSHRRHGTTGLLPTVITDTLQVIAAAVEAVKLAKQQGAASVLGIHIEGPFLDPVRRGAHQSHFIRDMTEGDFDFLSTVSCGSTMVTVAPNMVPPNMIRKLVQAGLRVSLGHSDATFSQVRAALDAGAVSFTHLYNAMSQLGGREPGMVGAALSDTASFIGVIADGHHVHEASMRLAFAATSPDRFMLVSDAMPPAAGGPDQFELQGRTVRRIDGRLQLDDGTLAGSNLTMDEAVRYCVKTLGLPLRLALQMASRNPARFLGRDDLGWIKPGARASLVHLDDDLNVLRTWVEGE